MAMKSPPLRRVTQNRDTLERAAGALMEKPFEASRSPWLIHEAVKCSPVHGARRLGVAKYCIRWGEFAEGVSYGTRNGRGGRLGSCYAEFAELLSVRRAPQAGEEGPVKPLIYNERAGGSVGWVPWDENASEGVEADPGVPGGLGGLEAEAMRRRGGGEGSHIGQKLRRSSADKPTSSSKNRTRLNTAA
ncbi:hypothetical protein HOY80DRAFT_1063901 [Tuber brumale]|nr:hypothetical protein HOY80DRAFT_1063901 [Tuber brumale]